jgi:hypothetical protein
MYDERFCGESKTDGLSVRWLCFIVEDIRLT